MAIEAIESPVKKVMAVAMVTISKVPAKPTWPTTHPKRRYIITPKMAVIATSKALSIIQIIFENENLSKEDVLKQIQKLDLLIKEHNIVPIHFMQQSKEFKIRDFSLFN